jgi:hypothetical protein
MSLMKPEGIRKLEIPTAFPEGTQGHISKGRQEGETVGRSLVNCVPQNLAII